MPVTDYLANAYAALVAALRADPFGSLVRSANLIHFDGTNPWPETRVRAPDQAVKLILDLGEFRDVGSSGVMPTAGECDIFDKFTQVFTVKLIGADKRTGPLTSAIVALRVSLRSAALPRGAYLDALRLAPMPAGSPEFDGSGLRGFAGTLPVVFNMPLTAE